MENNNVHKECINALNDLVQINNDRIEGYNRAINELDENKDRDLKSLFNSMIEESRNNNTELKAKIQEYGCEPTDGTTLSGKIYRTWMDVKSAFTGGDRNTVLNNCATGEEAAQKAYNMALEDDEVMADAKSIISRQKEQLNSSHGRIRALQDVFNNIEN